MLFYYLYCLIITLFVFIRLLVYYLFLRIAAVVSRKIRASANLRIAISIRKAFDFLGATYIKLGQIMAVRRDYFSAEICDESYRLFDNARPLPYIVIKKILQRRLKNSFSLIASVEEVPIGSASFAQVHRAVLTNSKTVAIKVQRPDIPAKVRVDVFYLRMIVALIDISTVLPYIKLKFLYEDFVKFTKTELDFRIEANNILRLAENLKENATFRIPEVYWELSNKTVLTMELFEGASLSEIVSSKATLPGCFNRAEAASCIIQTFLSQIFNDGFFHADPHPGNIIFLNTGKIGLIDFGNVGFMSSDFKRNMLGLLESVSKRDAGEAFSWAIKIVKPSKTADIIKLRRDYEENINDWFHQQERVAGNPHEKTVASLLILNISSSQRHRVVISNIIVQFYRCTILLESIAISISPETSLIHEMDLFFKEYERRENLHKTSLTAIRQMLISNTKFFLYLPHRLDAILNQYSESNIGFEPTVSSFLHFIFMLLNLISAGLFILFIVALGKRIYYPTDGLFWNFNVMSVAFISLFGLLVARFIKRYLTIEFS